MRRPKKWGKPAAIALFVLLIGGVGALQLMPVSTADYEKAASEAMGVPVKIGSARLSVITGIEARFENVSIGDTVKIRMVRGFPEIGTLLKVDTQPSIALALVSALSSPMPSHGAGQQELRIVEVEFIGELPKVGSWRTDIGGGFDFGDFGIYVAEAVSQGGLQPNFYVRLGHRF